MGESFAELLEESLKQHSNESWRNVDGNSH